MSKLTLFVVSGKIDRVGRLHGRSKFSSELVWRSWYTDDLNDDLNDPSLVRVVLYLAIAADPPAAAAR